MIALALFVAASVLFNAIELLPELTSLPNVNDDAAHLLFVERADQAITNGENPVDFWVPDLDFGFPQFAYYQHLPHLAVVGIYRWLRQWIDIVTVFNLTRYLLLVGLPLTVLWSMRLMGFGTVAAAIGAAASTFLASAGGLGFEAGSYVWRGYGVFTQLVAMHLTFVTLALLDRVLRCGRGHAAATASLAALVLSHLLYAYMMTVTALVVAALSGWRELPSHLLRLAVVGALAAAVSAYMLIPVAMSSQYVTATQFFPAFEYDSYGAPQILDWLVHGQLLDAGRLPVLTLLLFGGIAAALLTRNRAALLALSLFLTWLVLYFGRPTLGNIVDLLPFHEQLFFRRFIGGVHLGATLLIGVGGAWIWQLVAPWRHPLRLAAAMVILVLLFAPAVLERNTFYGLNAEWMTRTKAAIDSDAEARQVFATLAALQPGRVYAGQRTDWSEELDFGLPFHSVQVYNLLAYARIPALTKPYQNLSLNSDIVFDFDAEEQSHYAALGVPYTIAPSTRTLPTTFVAVLRTPLYTLYTTSAGSVAHYAEISDTVSVRTRVELLKLERAWLRGPDPDARVLRLAYPGRRDDAAGGTAPGCPSGTVTSESIQPGRVSVVADCPTAAALVFTTTYHPNWHVTSDGEALETFMVSPSFIGVAVPAGRHAVVAEYRSTPMKAPLLVLGGVVFATVVLGRKRWGRLDTGPPRGSLPR